MMEFIYLSFKSLFQLLITELLSALMPCHPAIWKMNVNGLPALETRSPIPKPTG